MRRIPALLLFLLILIPLWGDSSGILKTRLFEKEDGILLLEVDVPAIQEGSLGIPLFPARYRLSGRYREKHLDLLTLGFEARSYGKDGFSSLDTLELPWAVNGISLTVFRSDGTVERSLYKRGLTTISIPMDRVLPVKKTFGEELRSWMLRLLGRKIIFIPLFLLGFALGALYPPNKIPILWFIYFGGAAGALPFAEAGLRTALLLYAGILTLFLVLILSLRLIKGTVSNVHLFQLLGVAGFLTGLFCYGEFACYATDPGLIAAFYILTLILFCSSTLLVSLSVSLILYLTGDSGVLRRTFIYFSALASVFVILLLFHNHVHKGETAALGDDICLRGASGDGADIVLSQNSGSILPYPDAGLSLFVAMDPYELRLEVLVHLSTLIPEKEILSTGDQKDFLNDLEEDILNGLFLNVDGNVSRPLRIEAAFVQILNNGIALRSEAVDEKAAEGLIGVTVIYGCDDIPRSLNLVWNFFPPGITDLPVRMSAPWEDRAFVLSLDERELIWESAADYNTTPTAVTVAGIRVPALSLFLFLICIAIPLFGLKKSLPVLPVLLLLALLLYPRFRVNVPGPLRLSAGSNENMVLILDGLLGNLYRSFELKEDNIVYDRLALSVEGEFLQEVFLQNRRAMLMEERGGARARVEDVTMVSTSLLGSSDDGGILVNAEWTVSGAVSHFGHTHYRRNRYRGNLTLIRSEGNWKISDIILNLEEREL